MQHSQYQIKKPINKKHVKQMNTNGSKQE